MVDDAITVIIFLGTGVHALSQISFGCWCTGTVCCGGDVFVAVHGEVESIRSRVVAIVLAAGNGCCYARVFISLAVSQIEEDSLKLTHDERRRPQ